MERKPKSWINIVLFILCLYWFGKVVFSPLQTGETPWIFLDYANIIFHEAGHFIFQFFGDFMHVIGGSLMQLLVPAIAAIAFMYQKDYFATAFAFFWLGESASHLSFYIRDAQSQTLPLIGGDSSDHDWNWILNELGFLTSDTAIARVVQIVAISIMVLSVLRMGYVLYQEWSE